MRCFLFVLALSSAFAVYGNGNEYVFTTSTKTNDIVDLTHNYRKELSERAKYAGGTVFNITYGNESQWNETEKRAVEYAARLWEEKIPTCYPMLNLLVSFNDGMSNELVKTNIKYIQDNDLISKYSDYFTPTSYVKYLYCEGDDGGDIDKSLFDFLYYKNQNDIVVYLNSDKDLYYWGTDGETPADKYDAVTLIVRELAKCFGIGSTIAKVGNRYMSTNTLFDSLVGLDADGLKDADVAQKVVTGPAVITFNDNDLKDLEFYVPPVFEQGVSFCTLTEECADLIDGGAFAPYLPKGASFHNIPDEFCELMVDYDKLQWYPTKYSGIGGVSTSSSADAGSVIDYDEGKVFSSYEMERIGMVPAEYHIHSTSNGVADETVNADERGMAEWVFEALMSNGRFRKLKEGEGIIQIKPKDIPDTVDWARTADGYLRGRLSHLTPDLLHGGYSIGYYYIFLDYLPETPKVSAVTKVEQVQTRSAAVYMPKLELAFNALGSKNVRLKHESMDGVFYYDYNPDVERIDLGFVDPYIQNKITLTAENDNGTKSSNTITWGGDGFVESYNKVKAEVKIDRSPYAITVSLVYKDYFGNVVDDGDIFIESCRLISMVEATATEFVEGDNVRSVKIDKGGVPSGAYALYVSLTDGSAPIVVKMIL